MSAGELILRSIAGAMGIGGLLLSIATLCMMEHIMRDRLIFGRKQFCRKGWVGAESLSAWMALIISIGLLALAFCP